MVGVVLAHCDCLVLLQVVLDLGELQDSHKNRISCLGMSADGSALCTGSWDSNLKVSSDTLNISCYVFSVI